MHYPESVLCAISVVGVIVALAALSAGFFWSAASIFAATTMICGALIAIWIRRASK